MCDFSISVTSARIQIMMTDITNSFQNLTYLIGDKSLALYISIICSDIMNAPENKGFWNRSSRNPLPLKTSEIWEADRGCYVVVMDCQCYIEEGFRQIYDASVYLRTHVDAIYDIDKSTLTLHTLIVKHQIMAIDEVC